MNVAGHHRRPALRPAVPLAVPLAIVVAVLGGCAGTPGGPGAAGSRGVGGPATTLDIIGFTVAKSAYDQLGAVFGRTAAGNGVTFAASYGPSGAQSRAVIAGQQADVVAFSSAPDLARLVRAGLVPSDWDAGPTRGIASSSVVVIAVRKGNPKRIHGWSDLVRPGIGIVTADPGTSGSAKWNLLAAYAQALGPARDRAAAEAYLARFVRNVVSWNAGAREATDAFSNGTGDALISYENEAIAARAAGVPLDYLVPDSTILIENPAAVTTSAPAPAAAFLRFVESPAGQRVLAGNGFRPVGVAAPGSAGTATDVPDLDVRAAAVPGAEDPADPFPKVAHLITVADLGGWPVADATFFDSSTGLVTVLRKG